MKFRFEYASMLWDCVRAVLNKEFRWHARLLALFGVPLLLAVPAATLYVGSHPFGNPYAFLAALAMWPVLLESFAYDLRQSAALGAAPEDPSGFDFFLFALFTVLAIAAAVLLFSLETKTLPRIWLGILWGVALAGGLDFVRSALAGTLAATRGYPLYGRRPRK